VKNEYGFSPILIIIGAALIGTITAGSYFIGKNSNYSSPVASPSAIAVPATVMSSIEKISVGTQADSTASVPPLVSPSPAPTNIPDLMPTSSVAPTQVQNNIPSQAYLLSTNGWETVTAKNFSVKAPPGFTIFADPYVINFSKNIPDTSAPIGMGQVGIPEMGFHNNLYSGGSRRDWYNKQYFDAQDPRNGPYSFKDVKFGSVSGLEVYSKNGERMAVLVAQGTKLIQFSAHPDFSKELNTVISTLTFN
jgi:hypothetical protein